MTARCNITKSFLLKVLDESQQGVHIVDEEGNTLLYNKTAEAIDGMTKKEMISKNMLIVLIDKNVFQHNFEKIK